MLDIAERAKAIVVEQLVVDPDDVVDSANFIDDLGADSLDLVELAMTRGTMSRSAPPFCPRICRVAGQRGGIDYSSSGFSFDVSALLSTNSIISRRFSGS